MRIVIWFVLAAALTPTVARAQAFGCSTGPYAPTIDSATIVMNTGGQWTPLPPGATCTVLNQAECYCDSHDLEVRLHLVRGLPAGLTPGYHVWAGSQCDLPTRASQCEQLGGLDLDSNVMEFWQTNSGAYAQQGLPARTMISPNSLSAMTPHACDANSSNAMYFLFGDSAAPDYCYVFLPAQVTASAPPLQLTADGGKGTVSLRWTPPPQGTTIPAFYQVLCADEQGQPLPGSGAAAFGEATEGLVLAYSTCVGGNKIQRRGDLTVPGLSWTPDMAGPDAPDGGTAGVPAGGTPGVGPFTNLDKKFVCSTRLEATTTSVRLHFEHGGFFQFAVVGIDSFGNPAPSEVIKAVIDEPPTAPTADAKGSGCAVGGARPAAGPWGHWLLALAAIAAASRRRARRANESHLAARTRSVVQ